MGETDGSSNAAQRALSLDDTHHKTGFFSRIFESLTPSDTPDKGQANGHIIPLAMPHSILNLRRLRVEDVAIPKADIVAVPNTVTKDDLVTVFRDSGLSRIPIYDGTLDTPLGFVHLKDFALTYGFNGNTAELDLPPMLRPLLFVPPSMQIGVLLAKMQTERRHIALVIDEYGGVDGLVTIEDLIEQVVGEIEDEHDTDQDQPWVLEKPGCYVALAKTPLGEFEVEIGLSLTGHQDIDEEEIDTLGGLVSLLSGRVPARGEVVVHPDGTEFEIMDADPRRIKRLRVRLPDTAK
ncbi:MAG: magnesium and cobalt transporter [Paracoccaceae bacterium]|jgi:magnesium and cobalt transporter